MIVIDTSALIAIVKDEPDHDAFVRRIRDDGDVRLSSANYLESAMVCEGMEGAPGRALFNSEIAILEKLGLVVTVVDRALAEIAREAFRRYGKGRHPAGLNFGDCFAYALAKALDAPLLFKGDDFAKTDIGRA